MVEKFTCFLLILPTQLLRTVEKLNSWCGQYIYIDYSLLYKKLYKKNHFIDTEITSAHISSIRCRWKCIFIWIFTLHQSFKFFILHVNDTIVLVKYIIKSIRSQNPSQFEFYSYLEWIQEHIQRNSDLVGIVWGFGHFYACVYEHTCSWTNTNKLVTILFT